MGFRILSRNFQTSTSLEKTFHPIKFNYPYWMRGNIKGTKQPYILPIKPPNVHVGSYICDIKKPNNRRIKKNEISVTTKAQDLRISFKNNS